MNSLIKLHIANIDLCDITVDTIVSFIENFLENLDEVSKYKVAVDVTSALDNLSQTCYDGASGRAQAIIEFLENNNWDYKGLKGYQEYTTFVDKFLSTPELIESTTELELDEDATDMHDVKDEFGFGDELSGQFHFPRDYQNELALAAGKPSVYTPKTVAPVDPAEQKKRQRAEFLAQVKAQQNTSQPE